MNAIRIRRKCFIGCYFGNFMMGVLVMLKAQYGLAAIPLPSNQELLALHTSGFNANRDLYRIDTITGIATLIGETPFSSLQSLATGPGGTLYSWDRNKGLVTIDPMTAQGTDVNPLVGGSGADHIQSLAFSPSGNLFGITTINNGADRMHALYEIDTTTGALSFIGSSPPPGKFDTIRGIEFLGEKLVGVAWSVSPTISPFHEINPLTGAVNQIGSTGTTILNSLAQDSQGLLYSVQSIIGMTPSSTLVTLDPITGVTIESLSIVTPGSRLFKFSVRGLTIRTVPEPSAAILFLLASFVLTNCQCLRITRN